MMEFEEQKKKADASGGPPLLVGYDKLLYMSELQAVPGDDEYGNQDLDAKFTKFTHLKTEHITRLKREVIEILSSCEGNCLKLSQFKSRYHKRFGKKFSECYRLSGGRKEFCNLMAELDIIEFDQNGSRPLMKLKEPQASQHMSFNVAGSEHSCATDVETRETRRPRFVKRREIDSGYFLEKLTMFKKDIVNLLKSCEGNCLYLSELPDKYQQTFRRKFRPSFRVLFKGNGLVRFLSELDIIILERTGEEKKYLLKLKEPHANLFMQRTNLNTAEELDSSSNFGYRQDEFDSKEPTKSLRPASLADDLAVAAGPIIARVPTVPLAPLDQNVSDSRVQSPALETTFQASPLVLSTSLMRGPSHTLNIPEGM